MSGPPSTLIPGRSAARPRTRIKTIAGIETTAGTDTIARTIGLLAALALASCGGDSAAPPPPPEPPEPPRPVALTVTPDSVVLEHLGATADLVATVTDQYGAAYSGTVAWSSSDPQVVEAGTGGVVTAVSNGVATVVASLAGLSDSVTATVRQRPAAVEAASGDGQEGRPGRALPESVVVRVADAGGSPVGGVEVSFAGDGMAEPASAVSDSAGMAGTEWTLADVAGAQVLTAAVAEGPLVRIAATAEPFPVVSLTVSEASAPEGAEIMLEIAVSPAPKSPIQVAYSLAPDNDASTADADTTDYEGGPTGAIEVAAGQAASAVRIVVVDDDRIESPREVVAVTLDPPAEADGYLLGAQVSATATILEGVCDRTAQVRDEIVRSAGTSDGCASVADEDLERLRELRVRGPENPGDGGQSITSLKVGDFGGLAGLQLLDLGRNLLDTVPEGVFDGLAALRVLDVSANRLGSLPAGALEGLVALEELDVSHNRIAELAESAFAGLDSLRRIDLGDNALTELAPRLLATAGQIEDVRLGGNQIEALPDSFFAEAPQVAHVRLEQNRIASLPQGVFQELSGLATLRLEGNLLEELPPGFFEGLTRLAELRLDDNPGAPFGVALELERTDTTNLLARGPASIVLKVEGGAPFAVGLDAAVQNGSPSTAPFSVPAGGSRSAETVVTRTARSREPTLVELAEAPDVPEGFSGLELSVGPSLVLFAKPDNDVPTKRGTIYDHVLQLSGPIVRWDAEQYFDDDDPLVYSASAADGSVVSAEANGAEIVLAATGGGGTTVTVTATDPSGESASHHFGASVIGTPRTGGFDVDMLISGALGSQVGVFWRAARRWESVVTGNLPEVLVEDEFSCFGETRRYAMLLDDLLIFAAVVEIDGVGGVLARAGVCGVREGSNMPALASMVYDASDLANANLYTTVLHEMGHALGIGVLWNAFGLLRNPSSDNPGADTHFTGPLAVAAFNDAGGLGYAGAKVPVENQSGAGSDDTHWRYSAFGYELMNPFLQAGHSPLSAVTIQSLADMGYQVDVGAADSYFLPSAAPALRGPPASAVELHDDVIRGPVVVIGKDGRVRQVRRR